MSDEAARVLVVDDDPDAREVLVRHLTTIDCRVTTAEGVADALALLDHAEFDLVITDLRMPRIDGMDLVRHVHSHHPSTQIVMVTGFATISGAVEAVQSGAEAYLAKPFTEAELIETVTRALERGRTARVTVAAPSSHHGLIGESDVMLDVYRQIERAADSSATVLVTGESGTGKELVARAIHYASARGSAPIIPVNCGAIPEDLLESELFGYVRGAFTGANTTRAGFFQTAQGGTVFLDEVGETSPSMQVKLLRVLQDREIRLVGSSDPVKVDVRVVAATNRSLERLVETGQFRNDLFYRLNVLVIELPPLRDRGDDVLLLLHHCSRRLAGESKAQEPLSFTDQALEAIRRHDWPGNVRELENLVQRLMVMSDSETIDVHDLPPFMRHTVRVDATGDPRRTLAEVEAEHLRTVLASTDGNRTAAAKILGIDRKTLREKLKRLAGA